MWYLETWSNVHSSSSQNYSLYYSFDPHLGNAHSEQWYHILLGWWIPVVLKWCILLKVCVHSVNWQYWLICGCIFECFCCTVYMLLYLYNVFHILQSFLTNFGSRECNVMYVHQQFLSIIYDIKSSKNS
jgi:hypothetical protein